MSEVVLEVRNLVKHFPVRGSNKVVTAVRDVSLDIRAGETLALVGESGSGKTTVGRCILKLQDVTSGTIDFLGRRISELPMRKFRPLRSRIQLVFQEPHDALNPRMKVGETLDEPLRLEGRLSKEQRRARVLELIDLTRLGPDILDRYPHQVSGGEAQRIGIARAIATNPRLVVLDEPTSSLDISVRAEIIDLLIRLQEELGIAYLFISHDLTAVRLISHRVAVMYLGKLVELADTDDLFATQFHPYPKALLASVLYPNPRQPRPELVLEGEIPSPIDLPPGCPLVSRCPFALESCSAAPPPLEEIRPGRRVACYRSEEIFMDSIDRSPRAGHEAMAE